MGTEGFKRHDLGDLVRVSGEFRNSTNDLADPTAVNLSFRTPAGVTTTYIYSTDAELVKDTTGKYHVDIDANESGVWYYRFFSTGTGQAAEERQFVVRPAVAV